MAIASAFDASQRAGTTYYDADPVVISSTDYAPSVGFRAIYVGTTGTLVLLTSGGNTVTFLTVPVGIFPIAGSKVIKVGTTASAMIALF